MPAWLTEESWGSVKLVRKNTSRALSAAGADVGVDAGADVVTAALSADVMSVALRSKRQLQSLDSSPSKRPSRAPRKPSSRT